MLAKEIAGVCVFIVYKILLQQKSTSKIYVAKETQSKNEADYTMSPLLISQQTSLTQDFFACITLFG